MFSTLREMPVRSGRRVTEWLTSTARSRWLRAVTRGPGPLWGRGGDGHGPGLGPTAPGGAQAGLSGRSAYQALQLGDDLEKVSHQAYVGDLEDRGLAILVDGYDGAGVLDAGEMLDGAGDADRDVHLG